MITPLEVNPYAPAPARASSGLWVSGGGADGQVVEVMAWLLRHVIAAPESVQLATPSLNGREFDFAETIAWAVATSGGELVLPTSTAQLRAACSRQRTTLPVERARTLKGALLFGHGLVGVAVGVGDRVITHAVSAGIVAVRFAEWRWTEGGRIPGVRGYL